MMCTVSIMKEKRREGITNAPKTVVPPKEHQSSGTNIITHPILSSSELIKSDTAQLSKCPLSLNFLPSLHRVFELGGQEK